MNDEKDHKPGIPSGACNIISNVFSPMGCVWVSKIFKMGATCDELLFLNFLICFCKVTKTRFGIILLVSIIEELKRKIGTETDLTFFSAKYLGT